jgi:hypothetical protein
MPVILSSDDYDLLLDPAFRNTASISDMLKPFDPALMSAIFGEHESQPRAE